MVAAIVAMAFFTLLERKFLGYFQLRKGPNKVGLVGLPQPFADVLKLVRKELNFPRSSNIVPFIIAPVFALILRLVLWTLYPHAFNKLILQFSVVLFLAISRINVYSTLGAGWASNSKYALLGRMRRIAQSISYEVRISLILITFLVINKSLGFNMFLGGGWWGLLLLPFCAIIWVVSILAETNRAPFDFAEGESEIVSGFNIEYRRRTFALIFIAEYMNILVIRLFSSIILISLFRKWVIFQPIWIALITTVFGVVFIWARGALPRIRYDRLMALTWKIFLPSVLSILVFLVVVV